MRYFLHLAYKGTHYSGWQRQINATGIQEVFENALTKVLKKERHCHGCGRTDAGVHASQYFVHFDCYESLPEAFLFKLNKTLPYDVVVYDCFPVDEKVNAQFDAVSRTYSYYIHETKNPFVDEISACYPVSELNFCAMLNAIPLFLRYNDFRSLCLKPDVYKHTRCAVSAFSLYTNHAKDRLCFQITANRFLRGMVRMIVGRILDVGLGRISVEALENSLIEKKALRFNTRAYPKGLYLSKVSYPFLDVTSKKDFNLNYSSADWILLNKSSIKKIRDPKENGGNCF